MVFRFSSNPDKGIRRRGKIVISRAAYKFCPVGWRGRKYRRDQSRSGSRWINGLTYAVAELRVRRTASSGLNSVESISPRRKRQSSPGIPVFVHFPACLQLGFVSFRVVPSLSLFSPRSRLFPSLSAPFPTSSRFHCSRDFHGSKATDSHAMVCQVCRQTSAAFKQTRPTEAALSTAATTLMVSRVSESPVKIFHKNAARCASRSLFCVLMLAERVGVEYRS